MKKTLLISTLILLAGLGFTVSASAQDWNCGDLTWSATRLDTNPNIADHCLDVVERSGVPFAKLRARIERQGVNSTVVRYMLPDDGGWGSSERVFPGGFTASIEGKDVRIVDLAPRQEVNVYVKSAGNFTFPPAAPVAAAAPPPPPPPAPEPEPEPEPVALPTTATQVNLLALLGGLLILMGGMVSVVRTRL